MFINLELAAYHNVTFVNKEYIHVATFTFHFFFMYDVTFSFYSLQNVVYENIIISTEYILSNYRKYIITSMLYFSKFQPKTTMLDLVFADGFLRQYHGFWL